MKSFVPLLAAAIALHATPLCAAPDYTGFNQAVTNYFSALDGVAKKVPSVKDAAGTADLINAWSLANEIFAAAAEKFAKDNPEIQGLSQPPPEFAAAFGRLNRLNTDYPTLPKTVGALVEQFKDDPGVFQAFTRFQKSLVRLHISGSLQKSDNPSQSLK